MTTLERAIALAEFGIGLNAPEVRSLGTEIDRLRDDRENLLVACKMALATLENLSKFSDEGGSFDEIRFAITQAERSSPSSD